MNLVVDFSNYFIKLFLFGSVLSFFISNILEFIDYRARIKNGGKIPLEIRDLPQATLFDEQKLQKIVAYENAKYFFSIPVSIVTLVLNICLVIFGFYPFLLTTLLNIFGQPNSVATAFLLFFIFSILTSIPEGIVSVPFSLYREFVIEKKFGFSNMNMGLWIKDLLKNILLSLVLSALLTIVACFFFIKAQNNWWWILATLLIGFTFVMQIIYPKFIAPLFNKFSPLEEGELKQKITAILQKAGFKNGGLFVMDASKRSGHSNAYFSGFGKSKQIVLYDTLIQSMTCDELVAVLGHELGHYKLHHITKRIMIMIPLEFLVTLIVYKLVSLDYLYSGFGFLQTIKNLPAHEFLGITLVSMVYSSISELLSPIINLSSRRQEYQADAYSAELCGESDSLISGLVKLNSENLTELFPPAIYVFWNFSHPTLVERIRALKKKS